MGISFGRPYHFLLLTYTRRKLINLEGVLSKHCMVVSGIMIVNLLPAKIINNPINVIQRSILNPDLCLS
jgi:hypothetical protein